MARAARAAGRVAWIPVDPDGWRRPGKHSAAEWESTLRVLADARRWPELWQAAQRAPLVPAAEALRALGRAGWRPDGDGDRAAYARLVRLAERCTGTPPMLPGPPIALTKGLGIPEYAVGPRGDILAVYGSRAPGARTHLRLFRLPGGEPAEAPTDGPPTSHCLAFSPDSTLLASGSFSGVTVWRLPSGAPHRLAARGTVEALAFTPDGTTLVGADSDGGVSVWRVPSGHLVRRFRVRARGRSGVPCLALTPDGRTLVTASTRRYPTLDRVVDGSVDLWRLPSGEHAGSLAVHETGIAALHLTPGGEWLVASGVLGGTWTWSLTTGVSWDVSSLVPAGFRCVALSADGGVLVGAEYYSTARPQPKGRWDDPTVHRTLARTILVRRFPSGAPIGTIPLDDRARALDHVALSPDAGVLAGADDTFVGGGCGGLSLWSLPSGQHVAELLKPHRKVSFLAVTSEAVVAGVRDDAPAMGHAVVWPSDPILSGRVPVAKVTPPQLDELRRRVEQAYPDARRDWLDLFAGMVRWRHRHDVELGDATGSAAATDIEL